MLARVRQALEDLHQELRVRAVIITGAGSAFCAGSDMNEMLETAEQDDAIEQYYEDANGLAELYEYMLRYPKPIIAAVNGPATASGAGLVLACDLVIASPEGSFGLPEPRRGLVAGVVTPLLQFRFGGSTAARIIFSSELFDSQSAHSLGIFHEITPNSDVLWARACELVDQCALAAPEALMLAKRTLNETVGEQMLAMLTTGAAATATSRTTESAREGMQAFLEKREPEWRKKPEEDS